MLRFTAHPVITSKIAAPLVASTAAVVLVNAARTFAIFGRSRPNYNNHNNNNNNNNHNQQEQEEESQCSCCCCRGSCGSGYHQQNQQPQHHNYQQGQQQQQPHGQWQNRYNNNKDSASSSSSSSSSSTAPTPTSATAEAKMKNVGAYSSQEINFILKKHQQLFGQKPILVNPKTGKLCEHSKNDLFRAWENAHGINQFSGNKVTESQAHAYVHKIFYPQKDLEGPHAARVKDLAARHNISQDDTDIRCCDCGGSVSDHLSRDDKKEIATALRWNKFLPRYFTTASSATPTSTAHPSGFSFDSSASSSSSSWDFNKTPQPVAAPPRRSLFRKFVSFILYSCCFFMIVPMALTVFIIVCFSIRDAVNNCLCQFKQEQEEKKQKEKEEKVAERRNRQSCPFKNYNNNNKSKSSSTTAVDNGVNNIEIQDNNSDRNKTVNVNNNFKSEKKLRKQKQQEEKQKKLNAKIQEQQQVEEWTFDNKQSTLLQNKEQEEESTFGELMFALGAAAVFASAFAEAADAAKH